LTVYLEYWSKEKFEEATPGLKQPVCDLCSRPITKFPCPIIIAPFDYILVTWKPDGRINPRRSYVMKGGMAHCETCFSKVMVELKERGEEVILR